ncbi:MAG: FG-GAP-like repeat-containing protein [Deltaproteobacteria bacterium]|nr:FG-GAP-like repeat-containing protein [Deltaproteobacteria bacterium]
MRSVLVVACGLVLGANLAGCNAILGISDLSTGGGGDDAGVDADPNLPPAVPSLRSPRMGAPTGSARADVSLRPRFTWRASPGATRYELAVDDSCQTSSFKTCLFPSPEIDEMSITETAYTPTANLAVSLSQPVGARYFWRVRACNTIGCSDWSEVWYLDVGRLADDVNGDGYGDLVIGMVPDSTSTTKVGAAYIAFGRASGAVTLTKLTDPRMSDATFAASVAMVGDVNADGYADLVIGAPHTENNSHVGTAYLYLGRGVWPATVTVATTVIGMATGDPDASLGGAVAGRGDINGDGFGDFVVSAAPPIFGGSSSVAGYVHGYFGRPSWSFSQLGSDLVFPDPSGDVTGTFGIGVTLGDLNEDGRADLIAGAYGEASAKGAVAGYLGQVTYAGSPAVVTAPDFKIPSPVASGSAGFGASAAICVSPEAAPALAIAAPLENHPTMYEGVERIYAGRSVWATPIGDPAATLVDPNGALNAFLGISSRCGDVTGDGKADLVAGAPTGDDTGVVYVYSDAAGLPAAPLVALTSGEMFAGTLGSGVAVTDFDGDGVADVFGGAPRIPQGSYAGAVLGWTGRANWPATIMAADLTISNPSGVAQERLGTTLD